MDFTLRPMSTSEVLDRMFYLYKKNFMLFAGIAILPAALSLIVRLAVIAAGGGVTKPAVFSPDTVILAGGARFLDLLVLSIGGTVASAATVYALSMVHLDKTTSIGDSLKNVMPYFWRLMGVVFSVTLRVIGIGILMIVPFIIPVIGIPIGVVGLFVGLYFIVHLYARYSLAIPACVLEKIPSDKALERSSFLTKGRTGRIWLVFLLTGIINFALGAAIALPVTLTVAVMTRGRLTLGLAIAAQVAQFLASTLAGPIATVSIALLYYDERIRKEAFDLQYLMTAMDQPAQQQAAATAGQ
jgi:hypothetical protein